MNITDYVAIYGAVLSTIAIGWNIYNSHQDKPKIKVETSFGFFTPSDKKTFLFVTIINKGKRSIHLSSFGLMSDKESLIPNRITGVPCELKSGTSHNEWFNVEELKDRNWKFGWYRDETGKLYKSRSIKKMIDNYFKKDEDKSQTSKKSGEQQDKEVKS